jgi:hypothetical protein
LIIYITFYAVVSLLVLDVRLESEESFGSLPKGVGVFAERAAKIVRRSVSILRGEGGKEGQDSKSLHSNPIFTERPVLFRVELCRGNCSKDESVSQELFENGRAAKQRGLTEYDLCAA